jgi:folate-binding protein YgfZ
VAHSNPLHLLQEQNGAEFQPYGQEQIVSTYGNLPAEYSAVHKGAAKMDMPHRGVLEIGGRDRLDFLNRLITNQTVDRETKSPLAAGEGVYSYLLNGKGRIIADMNVLELGDRTWLEMDSRLVEAARSGLEKYVIADDVTLSSRLGTLHEIAMLGPKAAGQLGIAELKPLGSIRHGEGVVFRDDVCGTSGYFLILPAAAVEAAWTALPQRPVGWAAFNAARIEAGRPLMGIDFDETILPAETGPAQFARAVSTTKGCYLGQEIVARMHARGIIARQLIGIRMEGDALPLAGAPVYDGAGNVVGGITSSTISPVLSGAAIGLGLAKKSAIAAGTELTIPAEGAMHKGKVVELPFLK